jgi:hypothetical protein
MSEYDSEPVRGLPEALPSEEKILWQGSPDWKSIAQRTMHVKAIGGYFAVLLAWYVGSTLAAHTPVETVMLSTAKLAGFAALAVGLLGLFSWIVGRTTIYTITNRRVVLRHGIALPMMVNIPYRKIAKADFKAWNDGTGDIVLSLVPEESVSYVMLWPHARPWRINRTQPMLRGIPGSMAAAQILARALAAEASIPAIAIAEPDWQANPGNAARPAAAALG